MYYLIYGLSKEVSERTKSHKYGTYFSTFDNCKNYMLQSGQRDSIKFITLDEAKIHLEIAQKYFKGYTFYIVAISKLTLGIDYHRFVFKNGTVINTVWTEDLADKHSIKEVL